MSKSMSSEQVYFRQTKVYACQPSYKNTLRSAANRLNKSDFRGRCGTVNYHAVLNSQKQLTNDRPHLPLSHRVGFKGDRAVKSFNINKRNFHLASV